MKHELFRAVTIGAGILTLAASLCDAAVTPNPLFTDHAVLQRDRPIPVWGWADAGEQVTVSINGVNEKTMATADGKWLVKLPSLKAGGPFELVISGKTEVRVKDVYVGEVWLASGQSNMDFTVSKSVKSFAGTINEAQEIADANHPLIRMISVPLTLADEPKDSFDASWKVCSPETVPAFSAVGYFFAREINKSQNVPVGIITSAFGASCAQAWISKEALSPGFQKLLDDYAQSCADYNSGESQKKYEIALKEWELASEKAKADGKNAPRKPGAPKDPSKDQHNSTLCYNAMIAPLRPYSFRGAIWYQGESNGWDNERYLSLMTTLINDWRKKWENDFPFLFVQLASHKTPATQPSGSSQIAAVREAQRLTLALPNTAMACTIDIGDEKDVHPHNKQDVGRRLGLAARATVYGEQVEFSGPLFKHAAIVHEEIRIAFDHANGLTVGESSATRPVENASTLQGFAMLVDGKWTWADAVIKGDNVVIPLKRGQKPTEVRYAWADFPICNLFNAAGLPASPFRADLQHD